MVPLQKVPIEQWGSVRPREKQIEVFRRVATRLEQQWITDLQSVWNVTRWCGTHPEKKGRRNRRKPSSRQTEGATQDGTKPEWAEEQQMYVKAGVNNVTISTEPGNHRKIRKKIVYLMNWIQNKVPGNLELRHWKTETVQECLRWLQTVVQGEAQSDTIKDLEQMLQERLRTKRTRMTHEVEKKKGGLLNFIKVFHTNKLIKACGLRQVLHDPTVVQLHPDPKAADNLQVCDKLAVPLIRIFGNFTQVAYDLEQVLEQQPAVCKCKVLRKATDCREVDGHLVALDADFIAEKKVREWLAKGAKFRLDRDPRGVGVAIQEALDQYIELYLQVHKENALDALALGQWRNRIVELTEKNWKGQRNSSCQEVNESQWMEETVKKIQKDLVIVPVDKAGHNIAFVCKRWYAQKLQSELTNEGGAYGTTQESVEEVLSRHKEVNKKYGFQHVEAFPYLYGILKAHKQPVQLRFIAGCSKRGACIMQKENNMAQPKRKETEEEYIRRMTREKNTKPKCSLTDMAKEGVKILRTVMDTLREREEQHYKTTGIRKWWTVESIEEVALGIKDAEHKLVGKKMRTADFTTMYTKLPHERLFKTVETIWERAVSFKASVTGIEPARWGLQQDHEGEYQYSVVTNEKDSESMTKDTFMSLMRHLITENYIWNGKELRKQVIGIPMGSPVSPHLANLFRYVVEAEFVEDLIAKGQTALAQACEHTYGYIDDLCTLEGPLPSEELYGIPMTVDTFPRDTVTFLGMKITSNKPDRPPRLGIVEKQEEWNFAVIKYPHAKSNIPWNQGSAVFKGQLIRYAVICNNLWDFQIAALRLAGRLISRGHRARILIATWMRYLEERWPQQLAHKYRMQEWVVSCCLATVTGQKYKGHESQAAAVC